MLNLWAVFRRKMLHFSSKPPCGSAASLLLASITLRERPGLTDHKYHKYSDNDSDNGNDKIPLLMIYNDMICIIKRKALDQIPPAPLNGWFCALPNSTLHDVNDLGSRANLYLFMGI